MNSAQSNVHIEESLDFQKYWLVMKRRWLPATATLVSILGFSFAYAFSLEPIYKGKAKLLIKSDRSATLTGIENKTGEIDVISKDSDPLATEAEILRSRAIIEKLIQELDLRNDEGELLKYENLVDSLKVQTVTGTDVLEISYQDGDPELAASLVNKAIQLYQEQDTLSNRSEAAAARTFITKQLPQVEANVKQAETQLREFKNKYRIANLGQETSATISNLNQLENQIDAIQAELEALDARYSRLGSQLGISWQETFAIAALSESVAVQKIFARLQEVKLELVEKSNELSKNHPDIITLEGELAELQQLLEQEMEQTLDSKQRALLQNVNILALTGLNQGQIAEFANLGLQREELQQKLTALNNIYSSNKQRSDMLPQLEEQEKELQRRLEASQSTYERLLSQLQETTIAEEQNIGKVRVISEAVIPDEPVGPPKKKIVAAGGVLGTLLGLAMAFLLDIRDTTIKNTKEVEEMLAYPLQGVIPNFKLINPGKQLSSHNSSLVNNEMSVLPIRGAYQNIQFNFKLLEDEVFMKTLAVTSSMSGEGKTSVSANYATALAQSGNKVLLVDGDLRRPSQHQRWKIANQVGLTNVLNEEVLWQEAVQNVMTNLDVLTAGTVLDNPVTLLNSLSIINLLIKLSEHYDRIIFDTPPLLGLADSKIIGMLVDGLILVVRPGVAEYSSITAAQKILKNNKDLRVLGVVANGVDSNKESFGYEVPSENI